ncbi:cupin domain-containing protein [Paenibacillus sp. PDC88]|uniref:cupin domain-containing protein n=1 Tax=Paenibacillus sp. PDC88 TaxID=1884375 RepID=UPI00089D9018|nr:cupin domain-containing protein [Paenibacillus sp. PDC88]SDW90052.1 Uncharacterized protein YjlB [Paenibacillus sp. PDC88]
MAQTEFKTRAYRFEDDGIIPNHPNLPVLLYPGVLRGREQETEALFNSHNWQNTWTGGVFPYHHYHSNTHEVLGVISGSVKLQLGGEQGIVVTAAAGDVIVLPAGTGHKRIEASSDFQVVGGYPDAIEYDTYTGEAGERPKVLQDIKQVPLPDQDPVFGKSGPLHTYYRLEDSV